MSKSWNIGKKNEKKNSPRASKLKNLKMILTVLVRRASRLFSSWQFKYCLLWASSLFLLPLWYSEHWIPCRVVWVLDLVLCSLVGCVTFTVCLSPWEYKWLLANFQGRLMRFWGLPCDEVASHPGEGKAVWATRLRKRLFIFFTLLFRSPFAKI